MSVYFIGDHRRRVKIGHSCDPDDRMEAIQACCADKLRLLRVIDGVGSATEAWLHRRFKNQRINREWFYLADKMLTIVPPAESPLPLSPTTAIEYPYPGTGLYGTFRLQDDLGHLDEIKRMQLIELGLYLKKKYNYVSLEEQYDEANSGSPGKVFSSPQGDG
jgi:hypothetical protein